MTKKNKNKSKKNIPNISNKMNILNNTNSEENLDQKPNQSIEEIKSVYCVEDNINIINEIKDDTDKKIALYLINELEKKNIYITELEETVKNQEDAINQLNNKMNSINQVDLLLKLKSNMDNKVNSLESISKKADEEKSNESIQSKIIKIETENSDEVDNKNDLLKQQRRRGLRKF